MNLSSIMTWSGTVGLTNHINRLWHISGAAFSLMRDCQAPAPQLAQVAIVQTMRLPNRGGSASLTTALLGGATLRRC
jgi:hypothetical protein